MVLGGTASSQASSWEESSRGEALYQEPAWEASRVDMVVGEGLGVPRVLTVVPSVVVGAEGAKEGCQGD
jgi:hypothetical protein